MANIPEIFSTEDDLLRAFKEAVIRDRFRTLDVSDVEETVALIRREFPALSNPDIYSRANPIVFSSPDKEIVPALIKAMLAPKIYLLNKILQLNRNLRLATSKDAAIDSFGHQYYGDLVNRRQNETDPDLRDRIACLFHCNCLGEEFFFLPDRSVNGIEAFLACFGYNIQVLEKDNEGNSLHAHYWNRPERMAYSRAETGGWNDKQVVILVEDTLDTEKNDHITSLIEISIMFGTSVTYRLVANL